MKTIIKICLSTLLLLPVLSVKCFSQCSDAGVCQVGHLLNDEEESDFSFSFSYKNGYSSKDDDVTFHSFQLNPQYELFSGSKLALLIPYNFQSGPGGEANGLGDLILSWSQELFSNEVSSLNASFGLKFATGDENKNSGLPQIYQPGLGSNDLIFTIDYNYDGFSVGAGYQLVGGRNDKEGVKLKRGDDLLVRTSYIFSFDDFIVTPQLLLIKRLSKSSILDLSSSGESYVDVDKSDQLQLNLLAQLQYPVNERFSILAEAAVPFLKREVNIDGLTRAYSFSIGLRFIFN